MEAKSGPCYHSSEGPWLESRQVAHAQTRVARVNAGHRSEVCRHCDSMPGRRDCRGNESGRTHGQLRSSDPGDLR